MNLEISADIGDSVKYAQNIPIVAQEAAHTSWRSYQEHKLRKITKYFSGGEGGEIM